MDKKTPSSHMDDSSRRTPSSRWRSNRLNWGFMLSFAILFALWIVFSGRFDGFHLTMGLLSSAFVAIISGDLIFISPKPIATLRLWVRLFRYIPWLLYQIFLANLHVMYLVFHPKMMELINPKIIKFDSRLKSDYARMLFANSITLTHGGAGHQGGPGMGSAYRRRSAHVV